MTVDLSFLKANISMNFMLIFVFTHSVSLQHYQRGEAPADAPPPPPKKKKGERPAAAPAPPNPAGEKDLECPFPNCNYRTKLEVMMSQHIVRHQVG